MMFRALNHRHFPFQALTTAVILVLVFPAFLQHGMFMDGTQYAVVAQNMAEGRGTFWFPFLSSSWEKQGRQAFLEHPPLVYWLQSWFFRLFNSSIYSERMYALFTFLLSAQFIRMIWRYVFRNSEAKYFSWLPVLCWAVIPTAYWSYQNNMLENTVSVFVLVSVYAALKALGNKTSSAVWIAISAVFVFLAVFSKGLPGFFPVMVFLCYGVCFKKEPFLKMLLWSAVLLLIPLLLIAGLFYFIPEANESLRFYFQERLMYRVQNTAQVENRWMVLWWLICDLAVPAGLLFLVYVFSKIRGYNRGQDIRKRWPMFFLMLACCGVLPLMLTHVQRAVYYTPALPFFALGFAAMILPSLWNWNSRPTPSAIRFGFIFSFVLLASALFFLAMHAGTTGRDKEVLSEAHRLGAEFKSETVIGVPYSIYDDWDFQFYLLRYHKITLNPYPGNYQFRLLEKEREIQDTNYTPVPFIQLEHYKLYKKK
jgi:4-amino-4-deoxy-L-arabinose transferase-like glycosyltransferase